MKRVMYVTMVLTMALGLGGCAFKGEQLQAQRNGEAAQAWRPQPTQVRVHPATRFAMHNNEPVLEGRVELLDAMLDATKGSGVFRLELLDAASSTTSQPGRQLYVWDLQLRTLADHQQHWDPVTRAYYFPLKLDNFRVAERPTVLRITFTPAGLGERLTTTHTLP